MFTGLVEGLAVVESVTPEGPGVRLMLRPPPLGSLGPSDAVRLGDSIACNGCCLTVVDLAEGLWSFEAGEETLSRTNLGRLASGDGVNVERSLPATGRLGGHFVLGHVDTVGRVQGIEPDGQWVLMTFAVANENAGHLIDKGSITVDGISLTVCEPQSGGEETAFSVAVIPHTRDVTTLGRRQVGDAVNLEFDVLGKYVARMLAVSGAAAPRP